MQNLESLKNKGQESISNLIEQGKQQPESVKLWGVTAAAGVGGAIAVSATAKAILAVIGTLASPPIALTVGAVGGGVLGWSWIQKQNEAASTVAVEAEPAAAATVSTVTESASPAGTMDAGLEAASGA